MKIYTAYIIQAYEKKTPNGDLENNVELEIIANSENEAIKRISEFTQKEKYQINSVIDLQKPSDDKYLLFVFQGYDDISGEFLLNSSVIEVVAENSKSAELKAKTMVKKNFYRLWKVIERYART